MKYVGQTLFYGLMSLLNLGCCSLLDKATDQCGGDIRLCVQEDSNEIVFWVRNETEDVVLLRNAHNTYAYAVEYASERGDEVLVGGACVFDPGAEIKILPAKSVYGSEPILLFSISKPDSVRALHSACVMLEVVALKEFQTHQFMNERGIWKAFEQRKIYAENLPYRQKLQGSFL